MAIKTEKDLGAAVKNEQDTIEIEGDLARKVIKIKATGKVAWAVCIAAVIVAIPLVIASAPSGGTAAPAAFAALTPAIGVMGGSAAMSAVTIAVAAGGVGCLNKLRSYTIVSQREGYLVLKKNA